MDVSIKSPSSSEKSKYFSRVTDKHPKLFICLKKYKLPIILGIGVVIISVIIPLIVIRSNSASKKTTISSQKPGAISQTSKIAGDNDLLKTACTNALSDYPEWSKPDTDLVIWENPDKSFNLRNSPEDASTIIGSPVPPSETLVDMDFIGLKEVSFVTTSNNGWKIGIFKVDPFDKSFIYEKTEPNSFINVSPVNKNEFIAFVINGKKGVLRYINVTNAQEETITEISSTDTKNLKLAVSPKSNYVYLLNNKDLVIFDITSKKQKDKIVSIDTAVWVGNTHIFYSGTDGTYVYNLETKEKSKSDELGSILNVAFNPKNNGVIAYNQGGMVKTVNCQNWLNYNTQQNAELKTLVSSKTAITKKGDQYGYWRFKDADWGVKILEGGSKLVTVWQRY